MEPPSSTDEATHPFFDRVRYSDTDREGPLYGPHWKDTLVRLSSVPVQPALTGEPILLVGRLWYQHATTTRMKPDTTVETREDDCKISEDEAAAPAPADKETYAVLALKSDGNTSRVPTTPKHLHTTGVQQHYFHPVLHRSPQNVPHNQGRILMNLNVVMKARRTTTISRQNTNDAVVDRTQGQGDPCAPSPPRDETSSTMMTTTTMTTTIPETKDHTATTTKRTPKTTANRSAIQKSVLRPPAEVVLSCRRHPYPQHSTKAVITPKRTPNMYVCSNHSMTTASVIRDKKTMPQQNKTSSRLLKTKRK